MVKGCYACFMMLRVPARADGGGGAAPVLTGRKTAGPEADKKTVKKVQSV